ADNRKQVFRRTTVKMRPPVPPGPLCRQLWHSRAFTMAEMLVAMGISALVLTGAATFITMAATSLSGTTSQTFINYRASNAGEAMFRRIRLATKVDNGGDPSGNTLRVGIDENPAVDSSGDEVTYNDQDHWEVFQLIPFQNGN